MEQNEVYFICACTEHTIDELEDLLTYMVTPSELQTHGITLYTWNHGIETVIKYKQNQSIKYKTKANH